MLSIGLHLAFLCQHYPKSSLQIDCWSGEAKTSQYLPPVLLCSSPPESYHSCLTCLESFVRPQITIFELRIALAPLHISQAYQKCLSRLPQNLPHLAVASFFALKALGTCVKCLTIPIHIIGLAPRAKLIMYEIFQIKRLIFKLTTAVKIVHNQAFSKLLSDDNGRDV